MTCVLAVDLGGTNLKGAVVSAGAEVLYQDSWPTEREQGPDHVIGRMLRFFDSLARESDRLGLVYSAAGIVVPGAVDESRGIGIAASNLGWRDVPFADLVSRHLQTPVAVGHDIRAAALAEARQGVAKDSAGFFFMSIGTGIGGAIVVDGVPWTGASYLAAEIGHITLTAGTEQCACGRRGCLETVASANAIALRYAAETHVHDVDAALVCQRMQAGDPTAVRVWDAAIQALAEAMQPVLTLVNPGLVVIGGGLSRAGNALLDPLTTAVRHRRTVGLVPEIVLATLGDRAACVGAGLLALDLSIGVS